MTLAQAQKLFADSIQMKAQHKPYSMTEEKIKSFASNLFGKDKPGKVVFSEIGRTSSRIIVSHMAYLEDQRQLSEISETLKKYTTQQFETALLAQKVQIEEMKSSEKFIREAIGYKDGLRLTWNAKGECFFSKKRKPEYDLKFN